MKIFVTGATGFIGSHFVEQALAAGHQVVGLYHSGGPAKLKLVAALARQGAEMHRGTILDAASFIEQKKGVDCVCHFAAAFRESGVDDDHFRRLNVDGTDNIVQAAAAAGAKRVVLCSTAGIYGQRVDGVIDERSVARPWNIYEETKLASEEILRRRAAELGLEHAILRPTSVYGPRDERLLKLFRSAAKGRFPLFGDGDGRRHMVYVVDLAHAFLRACESPQAAAAELIVGGPRAVPLHEMLQTLAQIVGRKNCGPKLPLLPMLWLAAVIEDTCRALRVNPPIYRRRMDFYLNDAAFDCARAQRTLGWKPRVDLHEGLERTFRAYVNDGMVTPAHARPRSFGMADTIAPLAISNELLSAAAIFM